jgi:hypothetical protein
MKDKSLTGLTVKCHTDSSEAVAVNKWHLNGFSRKAEFPKNEIENLLYVTLKI